MAISISPMTAALGAGISDIDLARPMSKENIAAIRQALLDHLVVFFRDQSISPQDQLSFAGYFGEIMKYPFAPGLLRYPDVIPVIKLEDEQVNFGGVWHSDTAYLERPSMGAILLARELPGRGGDTLFSNMYLAYEGLSSSMKDTLATLTAVNDSAKEAIAASRQHQASRATADHKQFSHPVIRTHPETGRKALYVNRAHTIRFDGMTQEESKPMLDYLFDWQTRPEFTCRFSWEVGSIAFWDNRASQHYPLNDYPGSRRVMHRVSLVGDRPR